MRIESFLKGEWIAPGEGAREIESAVTGEAIALAGGGVLDMAGSVAYAREKGGAALRALTFHDRARMLKALAVYLNERKEQLYELSYDTGATLSDHQFDIDGGIGTLFVYASKGRREMPDAQVYLDGGLEQLGREGRFMGQHVCVPMQGVAVQINAFNFPVWGMLEKLAPAILGGMPVIVKPATATCYVTEACVRMMLESGILPEGALQFVAGGVGDLLDHLGAQDVLAFTGSADTGLMLRRHEGLLRNAVRFTAEQDSLNASILGPDVGPGSAEFDLFVKEVSREMTVKAGQKCTAIRRIIVPDAAVAPVIEALSERLAKVSIGDPRDAATRMGALVSASQKADVLERAGIIGQEAELVFGDVAGIAGPGAFVTPLLFHCADPRAAERVHDTEAFGPVSTVMGYGALSDAVTLANRGGGSLVTSLITRDGDVAREVVGGAGAWHGRIYINNADSMGESTGHGAPMPHMIHGGPGRAGGGEEMGGIRGVKHYMQRVAVQGSPDILSAVGGRWVPGAREVKGPAHPFTRRFGELSIGETLHTAARQISLEDIEHFAKFTGDTFYAHMDEDAAARNPFFPGRVAHGYLLLSFAAGLFVEPNEGPVLANTGLDNLRFMKPVQAGDSIAVRLTVKAKTPRNAEYGEVRWHVTLTNQDGDKVAEYELLTMNAF
ncbi:phenylacetic acid degradation bifunctional protein PaaZ [Rhodalgimonas zhirmunskyi]|uniref:Phenylacetic acid degradation bifunctional protein PaaZ n=1 Tax=Rhodalgimonas zhirmunskyi TaxID=2964767 RepID=A0AAJ1X4H7_9RHOB|nr:phenylacetic acid degradation bifunctional protein PaaZ [Rhodoalgimonas zhirmunskyi]MDQ2093139.1 phenylacetic acid degradation bifunctional protein PaaZ [Rhodoalgimonas zhirmunskyi]